MDQVSISSLRQERALRVFYGLSAYSACATSEWAWEQWQPIVSSIELNLLFYGWFGGSLGALLFPRAIVFRVFQAAGFLKFVLISTHFWGVNPSNIVLFLMSMLFLFPQKWVFRIAEILLAVLFLFICAWQSIRYWFCGEAGCNFSLFTNLALTHLFEKAPSFLFFMQLLELSLGGLVLWFIYKRVHLKLSAIIYLAVWMVHYMSFNEILADFSFFIPVLAVFIVE